MFKGLFLFIFGLIAFIFVGVILLETFPTLQPIWNEFKSLVAVTYNEVKVEYGALAAGVIAIGLLALAATSLNKR